MSDTNSANNDNSDASVEQLRQLVAYDDRLRSQQTQTPQDEVLETFAPELTKAMRALRDALGSTPTDSRLTQTESVRIDHSHNFADPSASQPDIGQRFELLEELGSGGFGIVFRAYDKWLKRHVAIKFLRPELLSSATLRQRFLRESRAAARLSHPFIVRVLEVSEADGSIWQVCELVEGASLSQHIAASALKPLLAARLVRDLVDAVAHAHASSVLHRDIKPDNILIDCQPGESLDSATLRLTDFGLARLTDLDTTLLSHTGMLVGTPRYMAPEQLAGKVDEHGIGTDIYAIGIVLYEMLSGKNPFGSTSSIQERLALVELPVPYVRKLSPHVPKDLATICHKCLEFRPERRYLSATDLRDDLDRLLRGDPTRARPLPIHEQLWRWSVRHRATASVLGILALTTGVILTQTLRNNSIYREQNWRLSGVNAQLTNQEQHSRELATLADKLRKEAQGKQERFADLAWKKGIREAYTSWHQRDFAEASELLAGLAESHPEASLRFEWRLLKADIDKQTKLLLDLPVALHEVRAIPNSQRVAVAGGDGNIYIVDIVTGEMVSKIETGIRALHALAISPDGRWLATAGSTNLVPNWAFPKIYDLETLEMVKQLPGQLTTVESLEYSSDGTQLACGSRYEKVKVFEMETGEFIELPTTRRNLWLAASPNSTRFAAQATGNSLLISDSFESPSPQILEFSHLLSCATWLSSGSALVVASRYDRGTSITTTETPSRDFALSDVPPNTEVLSLTASNNMVAAGLISGQVLLWRDDSQATGETVLPLGPWQLSKSPINSVAIQQQWLVAASHDGQLIRTLVPESAPESPTFSPPQLELSDFDGQMNIVLDWSNDGTWVLAGKANGEVRRLKLEGGQLISATTDPVSSALFSRQRFSMSAGDESALAAPPTRAENALYKQVRALDIAPDEQKWAYGGALLTEVLGNSPKESVASVLLSVDNAPRDFIDSLAFSPNSMRVAWSGSEAKLNVVSLTDGVPELKSRKLKGSGGCIAWSPQSERLAVSGQLPVLEFDPVSDQLTEIVDYGMPSLCVAYADEENIVSGHRDGTIRFVNTLTRKSRVLQLHPAEVRSISFTQDKRIGISLDIEANIGIWFAHGESIGLIENDLPTAYGEYTLSPKAWIDSQALKVIYNDRDGSLLLDSWNLSLRR